MGYAPPPEYSNSLPVDFVLCRKYKDKWKAIQITRAFSMGLTVRTWKKKMYLLMGKRYRKENGNSKRLVDDR